MLDVNLEKNKIRNCWRPIEEMLEARLWIARGTTSLIWDIPYLWNITTSDKWKVFFKIINSRTMSWNMLLYTFTRAGGHFGEINWSGGP